MRSNHNPSGPATRSASERSAGTRQGVDADVVSKLSMPRMPVEWLDAGSWRLPSGKALAEFALQAGFLAPLLFRADRFGKTSSSGSSGVDGSVTAARGKRFDKGFDKGDGR
jgi:hypothetical protein